MSDPVLLPLLNGSEPVVVRPDDVHLVVPQDDVVRDKGVTAHCAVVVRVLANLYMFDVALSSGQVAVRLGFVEEPAQ